MVQEQQLRKKGESEARRGGRADYGGIEAGGAHLVSRGGKVGRDLVVDVVDMTGFIRPAVPARLLGVHGSCQFGSARDGPAPDAGSLPYCEVALQHYLPTLPYLGLLVEKAG